MLKVGANPKANLNKWGYHTRTARSGVSTPNSDWAHYKKSGSFLARAVRRRDEKLVKILLDDGHYSPWFRSKAKNSLVLTLFNTSDEGNANDARILSLLLQAGADVTVRTGSNTALHYAAENSTAEATALLLSNGAQVNSADINGYTPLMWTTRNKEHGEEIAQLLISAGALVTMKELKGKRTALEFAKEKGHNKLIKLLAPLVKKAKNSRSVALAVSRATKKAKADKAKAYRDAKQRRLIVEKKDRLFLQKKYADRQEKMKACDQKGGTWEWRSGRETCYIEEESDNLVGKSIIKALDNINSTTSIRNINRNTPAIQGYTAPQTNKQKPSDNRSTHRSTERAISTGGASMDRCEPLWAKQDRLHAAHIGLMNQTITECVQACSSSSCKNACYKTVPKSSSVVAGYDAYQEANKQWRGCKGTGTSNKARTE